MLIKIETKEAEKFSKLAKINSYPLNPYWLAYRGFYERKNEETLIYERDILYENDFPFLVTPKKKVNLVNAIISFASEADLEKIKKSGIKIKDSFILGNEYYYKTKDFALLKGSRNFRKAVHRFEKKYKFQIKETYSKKKILEFLEKWKATQRDKNELFDISHKFEIFCIKNVRTLKGNGYL
jgi:hypothetical protein